MQRAHRQPAGGSDETHRRGTKRQLVDAKRGCHSLVDTVNELLLLYGMRRSIRTPDPAHPLGYGRELYFWSFIVAVLLFALGAGVSVYQGVARVKAPSPVANLVIV